MTGRSLCLGLLAIGSPAAAQQVPDALLVRCAEGSSRACLTASFDLEAEAARSVGAAPAGALDSAWRVRFRGDTGVAAFARRTPGLGGRTARVLLLVDVSGSMRNLGIGTAKIAVKDQFLRPLAGLPAGQVQVAVAPFGSVDVASRIAGARFGTPLAAIDQVEALPPPDRENTGLYSAAAIGARRLAAELAEAGPDALGLLVVLTDGNNDVDHPIDDPGLLAGQAGLQQATAAVAGTNAIPLLIGLGRGIDPAPLRTLAGSRGRSYQVELDAFDLAQPFADAVDLLSSTWEVAFVLPAGGREELGRAWATVTARLALGQGPLTAGTAVWRPPVMALPAFSGVVSAGVIPAAVAAELRTGGLIDRRLPLVLFLLVLLGLLWLVVPRLLWPRILPPGQAAEPARKTAPRAGGGLRTDVNEAPARKPADITAARARAS